MAELGKIEKPEASTFTAKRKLYVVPALPFEEIASHYGIDSAKVERFWGEVREKIAYFESTYGKIGMLFIEGINEDEKPDSEHFKRHGKENNHYLFIKNLLDSGAVIRGIEKKGQLIKSKLLFEEYSKSFMPEIEEFHRGYYGMDINFDGWREYIMKKIQEIQDDMGKTMTGILGELPSDSNGILIITDGRPVEFPEGIDVFQIRPPAFDEIEKKIRDTME